MNGDNIPSGYEFPINVILRIPITLCRAVGHPRRNEPDEILRRNILGLGACLINNGDRKHRPLAMQARLKHFEGRQHMGRTTDYWAKMEALKELENSGLTQVEKAKRIGIAQARVSLLERIRTSGTPELKELIRLQGLPSDALKYLPLLDAYAEVDWVSQMISATPAQRTELVQDLRRLATGISPPPLKEIRTKVTLRARELSGHPDDHFAGVVAGIGYVLGMFDFDTAKDPTGRLQLNACEKLCQGRKPAQYHWARNFFSAVVASRDS